MKGKRGIGLKKLRTVLCFSIISLCLPGIFLSARRLPWDKSDLIGKKYAGWSGVLTIRAFEGWSGGDGAAWIRRCAAAFEKAHPGVYIEIKPVSADRLSDPGPGVHAPDMILFPPGLLSSIEGLAPLDALPVRAELLGAGQGFAAPVAMGGYGWAVNEAAPGTAVPPDEQWRRWSRAAENGPDLRTDIEVPSQGVDLGLPASAPAADPLTRFINGELGAMCVTRTELQRLVRLSDQGRGPDWTFAPGGGWTDQILYLSALKSDGEREQLSRAFIAHLLTHECQRQLVRAGLFSVLDVPAGYTRGSAMSMLEDALLRPGLTTPTAFNINPEPGSGNAGSNVRIFPGP